MESYLAKYILHYSRLGIEDNCEDPEIREMLLEYIDSLFESIEQIDYYENEMKVLIDNIEYGTIEDCMVIETFEDLIDYNS